VNFPKGSSDHQRYDSLVTEFIEMFLNKGKPTYEESKVIHDKQTKPAQKRALNNGSYVEKKFKKHRSGFVKAEPYPTPKPARPIIQSVDAQKEGYSKYTLGLQNHMKANKDHFHWYAFGLKPAETAEVITQKARKAKKVAETDFTAFDVTVNEYLRLLENKLLHKCFGNEAATLHAWQLGTDAYFETKEKQPKSHNIPLYFNRHSGSPETSVFNTVINAFVAFCTFRTMGLKKQHAWKRLGLYGGDDGVTFDIDVEMYMAVAKDLGLILKCKQAERGQSFNFLARQYYACSWENHGCSLSNPTRLLGKAHLSSQAILFNDPNIMLVLKATSFMLNDNSSPIIRTWAETILRILGPDYERQGAELLQQLVTASDPDTVVIDGVKLRDHIGYNYSSGVYPAACDKCVKQHMEELIEAGMDFDKFVKWHKLMQTATELHKLPTLILGKEQEFNNDWTKIWHHENGNQIEEMGTLPKLEEYPPRKVKNWAYFDKTIGQAQANGKKRKKKNGRASQDGKGPGTTKV